MTRHQDDNGPPSLGWGCLVVAILIGGALALAAIIFLWDVNIPR